MRTLINRTIVDLAKLVHVVSRFFFVYLSRKVRFKAVGLSK